MNPGLLITPIELLIVTGSVVDSYNQSTDQYSGSICFAKVVRKSGGEAISNGIGVDRASYTFMIRYRTDVNEKSMIKFEGRTYNVSFIAEPVRKAYLELTAERMKNGRKD